MNKLSFVKILNLLTFNCLTQKQTISFKYYREENVIAYTFLPSY